MDSKSHVELARRSLVNLLTGSPGELGARLKQRLLRDLALQGVAFDEREFRFEKFVDFLAANSDLVAIDRPSGAGDVTVRLRNEPREASQLDSSVFAAPVVRLRTQIWKAFANPDALRKRFLERSSAEVVHFPSGVQENAKDIASRERVARDPDRFIEIEAIPGEQQLAWMREFLEALRLPERESEVFEQLLRSPYSSQLNAVFSDALGRRAPAYQRLRSSKIVEHVQRWATKHGFDMMRLTEALRDGSKPEPEPLSRTAAKPRSSSTAPLPRSTVAPGSASHRLTTLTEIAGRLEQWELDTLIMIASVLAANCSGSERRR